ncbi:MAG: ABC transporter substrate-binding protein [Myxococcota bacterium]
MTFRHFSIAAGLMAFLSMTACAGLLGGSASVEERRAFSAAQRAEPDRDEARAAFQKFLARYPDSVLAPDAELALGDLDRAEGKSEAARQRYSRALEARGSAVDRARVRLAALELEAGDSAAARSWLAPVRLSRLEGADLRNAYESLAESAEDPAERLRWLAQLRGELPDPEALASLDAEIDSELARLPAEVLEEAARRVGDRPPAARIYLTLAERYRAEGRVDEARDALDRARSRALAPRYAARLAAAEANLGDARFEVARGPELPRLRELVAAGVPRVAGAQGTLGVLLPLTGPYASYGEHALQGVLLAAGSFQDPGETRIRVVVRDSAGDPSRAAAGVRELAAEDAVAIVGPMLSTACEAAAEEAESLGVPLLALSARESIARDRDWAFRVRTRPVEEAELLVQSALDRGDQRFAILYPDHAAGLGFRGLFWDAAEARGGEIVGVASYDPEATDFGESIRSLVGYDLIDDETRSLLRKRERMLKRARRLPDAEARSLRAAARSLKRRDGEPIPPIVDFDALFIPDSHQNVVLIAPQLAFHEVRGPRLLGTGAWYDDDLVRLAARHLDGALFTSSFSPDSELSHVKQFTMHFERVFGAEPEGFAAQSYDAARLVLVLLAHGDDDRGDLRAALLDTRAYPGVSGVLGMQADGNARKRPFLLGVEDGRIAPQDD